MINVGFIGAGDIARTHAAAVAQVDGARLAVVTDENPQRAARLAAEHGASTAPDIDALLSTAGLDVVYILTPPAVHLAQIEAAVRAGLPLMCEKPLTLTLPDAQRAIDAAAAAGVPLMTGLTHRYHPLGAQAREMLHRGELGDLVAIWSHRLTTIHPPAGSWLGQRARSGGVALQYAMHDLDWVAWLVDRPATHVSANEAHTRDDADIEDNLWALVRFEGGASGSVGTSWTAADPHTERGVVGSRGNLRIVNQKKMIGQKANGERIDVDLGEDYDWFDVFVRESADIVECVRRGGPFSVTGEDGRDALALSLAVQRAALSGRMIEL